MKWHEKTAEGLFRGGSGEEIYVMRIHSKKMSCFCTTQIWTLWQCQKWATIVPHQVKSTFFQFHTKMFLRRMHQAFWRKVFFFMCICWILFRWFYSKLKYHLFLVVFFFKKECSKNILMWLLSGSGCLLSGNEC